MAGPLRVEHDVEVARWVQEGLAESATVEANIPPVFDAYARILHPATLSTPVAGAAADAWGQVPLDSREITWVEAALTDLTGLLLDEHGDAEVLAGL